MTNKSSDFQYLAEHLESHFKSVGYDNHVQKKELYARRERIYSCSCGSNIWILYPGYKAIQNPTSHKYDFRVDLEIENKHVTCSHLNLIVDLFNKGSQRQYSQDQLLELVHSAAFSRPTIFRSQSGTAPSPNIRNQVALACRNLSRVYSEEANKYDLSPEQFCEVAVWIFVQEEMNYPSPKFRGRSLALERYIEAIHVLDCKVHSLEEVIERALMERGVPPRWNDVDYTIADEVRNVS